MATGEKGNEGTRGFTTTNLDGVWLPAPHVELVVAHAEGEDALVDPQPRREEHKVGRLRVDRLDHELAVVERDVSKGERTLESPL